MSPSICERHFELLQAPDIGAFMARPGRIAESLGFPLFNAFSVRGAQAGSKPVFRYEAKMPPGWEAYANKVEDIRRDPAMNIVKRGGAPFAYDQDFYVRYGAGDLWEEQAPFGYRTGIVAPVHMLGGRMFMLGFDRDALAH
jgi:hypothetical protein